MIFLSFEDQNLRNKII